MNTITPCTCCNKDLDMETPLAIDHDLEGYVCDECVKFLRLAYVTLAAVKLKGVFKGPYPGKSNG